MNIYESLANVMSEIGAVGKGSYNPQGKFKYRGIDAVMNALQPALIRNKVVIVPEVQAMTREERDTKTGGKLIYTILDVQYTFYAEDGTFVKAKVTGEAFDSGDKSANKAMSAAFKYALFQVFCIPTEEMKDPDAESYEVEDTKAPKVISDQQYREIVEELKRTGVGLKGLLKQYKIQKLEELTADKFDEVINVLKAKPTKTAAASGGAAIA